MPELWATASLMELDEFLKLRDDFVARDGEPKRLCDTYFPESYSCLHKTNPNMVPMTFYGMRMLHQLWSAGCEVPPMPSQNSGRAELLESMPGAVLRALGLPYKGYKNGTRATVLRNQILENLSSRSAITLQNFDEFKDACLENHDCLDALVAAVAAALWVRNPQAFRLPTSYELEEREGQIFLEGWLYAPVFINGAN